MVGKYQTFSYRPWQKTVTSCYGHAHLKLLVCKYPRMKEVSVPPISADNLAAQLEALYKTFVNRSPGERLNFNLQNVSWTCPLLLLPLSAYIKATDSTFTVTKNKVTSYLEAVRFPNGVDSISSFEQQTQSYKNFIPISVLKKKQPIDRERLETMFAQMIVRTIDSVDGARNAIYYPISELVTNIFEHSNQNMGFIFAQWYPNKNYLDICIVDCGRGLAQAYKDEKKLNLTHKEAIIQAMSGRSIKADIERGFGLRTSKRVVHEGLGGGFILISGDSALYTVADSERLVSLPNFAWQGVIVAYRIPKPSQAIDITPYLE